MPATTISNGRTGALVPAGVQEIQEFMGFLDLASRDASDLSTMDIVDRTIGTRLHVCEFWMPGPCNLHCTHCYVSTKASSNVMSKQDYAKLTRRLVRAGLVDVVIPGMEPLLRPETWVVTDAARDAGAESIGITTNGTLIHKRLDQLLRSGVTVVNVSVDGPEQIHDSVRGRGTFKSTMSGVSALRSRSTVRLITNTTVQRLNSTYLPDVARLGADYGVDYAAFHPYEWSSESEHTLALSADDVALAYQNLIDQFRRGRTGSIALEMDASVYDVAFIMAHRGLFDDLALVSDERGSLFFYESSGGRELLVNLAGYPMHFVHTVRVADNGGLTSCRSMAHSGWQGVGDLRCSKLPDILASAEVRHASALIWDEFRLATARAGEVAVEALLSAIEHKARRPSSVGYVAPLSVAYA